MKEAISSRINILGVSVSAINPSGAEALIENWISNDLVGDDQYVCVTGAHGIMESRYDPKLRRIHNRAGLVAPDGMPVVWLARALGAKAIRRVYGPDLMRSLSALSARKGYRQFYYGGAQGVAESLKHRLCETFPGLVVVGTACPPFRSLSAEEDAAEVEAINRAGPDILWIGLSTPKQEQWMSEHRSRIKAPVMIGVGAAFDFLTGAKPQAPVWMQRSGVEWLFRLISEPRRLWRRYAFIVPGFALLAIRELCTYRARTPLRVTSAATDLAGRGDRDPQVMS